MLFDLRGRGRRRTVQVIYLSLAILMGGGLVLFGIGGATSGGLVDAITGNSDTKTDTSVYDKKVKTLQAQLKANPKNAAALAALTRAQVQQASVIGYDQNAGTYSRQGIEGLQAAGQTWDRYLALDPKNPDAGVAALMVSAYSSGALNDPQQGARALDVVIDARGGSAALYSQLAILHYAAGDVRRSVIAEKQATDADSGAAPQASEGAPRGAAQADRPGEARRGHRQRQHRRPRDHAANRHQHHQDHHGQEQVASGYHHSPRAAVRDAPSAPPL